MNKNEIIKFFTNYLIKNHNNYILFITNIDSYNIMNEENNKVEFVIITDTFDLNINKEITNFIRENCKNIDIDISLTPKEETKNETNLNYKVMLGLYLTQIKIIKPLYSNISFNYFVNDKSMQTVSRIFLLDNIYEARKIIFDLDNFEDKKIIKNKLLETLNNVLLSYLLEKKIFPKSFEECLNIFYNISNIKLEIGQANEFENIKDFTLNAISYIMKEMQNREVIESTIQDIRIKTNDIIYKVRAGGLLKYKNKYLLVNMGTGPYWCVPGGHLELFENSNHAVIREFEEETKMKVNVKKLFLLNENFYIKQNNIRFHEMAFYYLVTLKNGLEPIKNKIVVENDKGLLNSLEFRFFTKKEIANIQIQPSIIKELILSNGINKFNHIITQEN